MAKQITITAKDKFNAMSNAKHIFAFKEEGTKIKVLEVIKTEEGAKAIVLTEDGEIQGLFTDAKSAVSALNDLRAAFGDDQPEVVVKIRETAKKQSVYYFEIV